MDKLSKMAASAATARVTDSLSGLVWVVALIYLALVVTQHPVKAQQKWQQANRQQAALNDDKAESAGEKIDRLASATGDLFWQPQPEQLEWLLQPATNGLRMQPLTARPFFESVDDIGRLNKKAAASQSALTNGLYLESAAPPAVGLDGPGASLRNYHDLVDEFKQYSRMANPSRESRAFRPKLMSTARGFGKRAYPARITYPDLFEAANSNGAMISHGKMSEGALR